MRKTLAILATVAAISLTGACGHADKPTPTRVPVSATVEPTADTSGEVPADGGAVPAADITGLKVSRADPKAYPDATDVNVAYTITNSGTFACTFDVLIGIFDVSNVQVATVQTDTIDSAPTTPGGKLHVTGVYGADTDVPATFTARVVKAERIPA